VLKGIIIVVGLVFMNVSMKTRKVAHVSFDTTAQHVGGVSTKFDCILSNRIVLSPVLYKQLFVFFQVGDHFLELLLARVQDTLILSQFSHSSIDN
jgi:hypothetical protein